MLHRHNDNFFETPIEFVKGVGPKRAELLKKELNIFTSGDLIYHFPFRYVDRSRFYKIAELKEDLPYVQLRGKITSIEMAGEKRGKRLIAELKDETGTMELVFFQGIKWIKESLKLYSEYVVFGKPSYYKNQVNMVHPEMELASIADEMVKGTLQPMYNTTEKCRAMGLDSKGIYKIQRALLQSFPSAVPETLSPEIIDSFRLISLRDALIGIHLPSDTTLLRNSQFRLKFDELFYIQLRLLINKVIRKEKYKGKNFEKVGELFNTFYSKHLPFELTNAQKKVLKEIRMDTGSGKQMNRLLQGDVGSGKTIVALLCMLLALDNNYQACLMAPTEILAQQHFISIADLLKDIPVKVELLTGSTKGKTRKAVLEQLITGEINILIGTHALIENEVQFKNIGLVIIDEQHRFGVEQRSRLWAKDPQPPHVLVMTATPIPRTLAMTLYGDLDVSVINELPPGRKPIKTYHRFESSRLKVISFLKEEIKKGRQIYIVYPLIEESAKMDYANLMAGYDAIVRDFPLPDFRVNIVHGKMKTLDRDYEMHQFAKGKSHIMVATTVIEVGVNIPNASVMVIESAERFGLSQLHQLRGRVGRGVDQSYCILMTSYKLSAEGRIRMETMVRTQDGFEIAETDLKLRGPGDITGTQQSGVLDLKIAELGKDSAILEVARTKAIEILEKDPHLEQSVNAVLRNQMIRKMKGQKNWSRIS